MYVIYGGLGRLSRVTNNEILRRLSSWRRMKMTRCGGEGVEDLNPALSLATGFINPCQEFAPLGDFGALFLHLEMSEQGAGTQVLGKYCRSVS